MRRDYSRGGRPKKAEDQLRNVVIAVHCTAAEHDAIKAAAADRETSMSAYLHDLGMGLRRNARMAMDLLETAERIERLIDKSLPESLRGELIDVVHELDAAARRRTP